MVWMEEVWQRIEAKVEVLAARRNFVSMGEARLLVLEMCRETGTDRPRPDALEFIASEFVQMTLDAQKPQIGDSTRRVS